MNKYLKKLVELGELSQKQADFLSFAVNNGCNILVTGPVCSGKTRMMEAIVNEIPEDIEVSPVFLHTSTINIPQKTSYLVSTVKEGIEQLDTQGKPWKEAGNGFMKKTIIIDELRFSKEAYDMIRACEKGYSVCLNMCCPSAGNILTKLNALYHQECGELLTEEQLQYIDVVVNLRRTEIRQNRVEGIYIVEDGYNGKTVLSRTLT